MQQKYIDYINKIKTFRKVICEIRAIIGYYELIVEDMNRYSYPTFRKVDIQMKTFSNYLNKYSLMSLQEIDYVLDNHKTKFVIKPSDVISKMIEKMSHKVESINGLFNKCPKPYRQKNANQEFILSLYSRILDILKTHNQIYEF